MPFQSVVRARQTQGFAGQVLREVPSVVETARLNSQLVLPNRMGYAFTYVGETASVNGLQSIKEVVVGGAGKFVGILCHPEMQSLSGTTAGGTLAPSMDVPASEVAQIIFKGAVVAAFDTAVAFGDPIYFVPATGGLANVAGAGNTLIVGASVSNAIAAAGLTTIFLG